jgi:hypothetical protein
LWAFTVPIGLLAGYGPDKPSVKLGMGILGVGMGLATLLSNPQGIRAAYRVAEDAILREWEKRTRRIRKKPPPVDQPDTPINQFGLHEVSEFPPPVRLTPDGFPPPEPLRMPLRQPRLGPRRVLAYQLAKAQREEAQEKLRLG